MDGSGHRENGRHKTDQYKGVNTQWMIPSHMMKDQYALSMKFMAIITERDTALQERDLALSEKRAALAERDMAILQRDAAINERNNALMERDNAIASYYHENDTMNCSSSPTCLTKFGASRVTKHMHLHQHGHHPTHLAEDNYHTRDTTEVHTIDALPITGAASEAKPQRSKRTREMKTVALAAKKTSKPSKKCKRKGEDLNKKLTILDPNEWKTENGMGGYGEDLNKELVSMPEWKDQDLSLNQVFFDDSSMPVPVCSCTGVFQQCYKWGNGGWQSACCTTTLSMHPLPMMPNKRRARIGGRKMSGSAFTKLLSRLASEGHDLSIPLDLKDHWAKHGTNRYITIK